MSAQCGMTFEEAKADREFWGHLVESAIGAHLVNAESTGLCKIFYWREQNHEVDFVVKAGRKLTAIEVKSGRTSQSLPGTVAFTNKFKPKSTLLVGSDGIPIKEFLLQSMNEWLAL